MLVKVSRDILSLKPYQPGKPISEVKRELGLNDVYKLASNENPLGPSPLALAAIQAELNEVHRYPDAAAFTMVQAFAKLAGVSAAEVAFGNGSNELIDLLIRIYCEPGDAIATSAAAFIAYKICAQAARVRTVESPLSAGGGFDLGALRSAIENDSRVRLVFIANPNNPTGTHVSVTELKEFLRFCAGRELLVVMDEAYVEYVRAKDYVSGLKLRTEFGHVVVLRTMSKAYGLAGLRVGFAIARPDVVDLIQRVRNPFNVSSLAQAATVAALSDQVHVKRVCELTWQGLDYLKREIKGLGLSYLPSEANFLLVDCGQDCEKLFNSLLRRGVIVRPVRNYGLPNCLRISVGTDEENRAAMRALKAELSK
jgi:histidinol-phosphate aminotransferase